MTATEIIEKLKEEYDVNYFPYELENDTKTWGDVEEVDSQGDYEGGGDFAMKVLFFKDHNVYIRQTGFYSSYNGTDWNDDYREVFPKEKTITVFE